MQTGVTQRSSHQDSFLNLTIRYQTILMSKTQWKSLLCGMLNVRQGTKAEGVPCSPILVQTLLFSSNSRSELFGESLSGPTCISIFIKAKLQDSWLGRGRVWCFQGFFSLLHNLLMLLAAEKPGRLGMIRICRWFLLDIRVTEVGHMTVINHAFTKKIIILHFVIQLTIELKQ